MMSEQVCSHPSLETTGRDGSIARVRSASARLRARCSGRSARCCTPQLSLIGTQVAMLGWERSRRTAAPHSATRRVIDCVVNS